MPTFIAIALDNLLERDSPLPVPKQETNPDSHKPYHTTPIPSCPAISSSPYAVNNRKLPAQSENRLDGFEIEEGRCGDGKDEHLTAQASSSLPFPQGDKDVILLDVEIVEANVNEGVFEGFFDPCDSLSVGSTSEVDEGGCLRRSPTWTNSSFTSHGDYYDAPQEFFSDGSTPLASPSSSRNLDAELRATRINLLEEIERRKKAEEALNAIHKYWQRISRHLSKVGGLSFPMISIAGNMVLEIESGERLCQEVAVARFVSEAFGRGQARAEAEAAAEAVIESKNHEIARLRDKLHYCEAVNHEMSQRNQEIIEISSQQRQRRKMRQRWLWSFVGMSIALGASVLADSYVPHTEKDPSLTSTDCSNTPPVKAAT